MSGYLPPGVSEHDPIAPWNQDDPEDCYECKGSGIDPADPDIERECPHCDGTGFEPEEDFDEFDLSDEKYETKNDR